MDRSDRPGPGPREGLVPLKHRIRGRPRASAAVSRGHSSTGRALPLQGRGWGFESPWLHRVLAGQRPGPKVRTWPFVWLLVPSGVRPHWQVKRGVKVQVSFATEAGSAAVPNEDALVAAPNAVVVVDGVTAPKGLSTGCIHGTPWYASTLAAQTIAILVREPAADLKWALAQALSTVAASHTGTCDLTAHGTPSATVALMRTTETSLDYLVLSDATVAIQTVDGIQITSDNRIDDLFGDLRQAVQAAPVGSAERESRLVELVTTQRRLRNVEGGYWLAGAIPDAAERALTGTVPLADVSVAAAMSDGASRLVDLFALHDWPAALELLKRRGPEDWIRRTRDVEESDAEATRWPRYKKSDDATIACMLA